MNNDKVNIIGTESFLYMLINSTEYDYLINQQLLYKLSIDECRCIKIKLSVFTMNEFMDPFSPLHNIEGLRTIIEDESSLDILEKDIFKLLFNNVSNEGDNNTPNGYIDVRKIRWTKDNMYSLASRFKSNELNIYQKYFFSVP